LRPHAKPINTDYIFRATGSFAVTWVRGDPGDPGGASAGLSMSNCMNGDSKSLGAGAAATAGGAASAGGAIECRRRSSNFFGYLESDVGVSWSAAVHQWAGNPQEFTFEGTVEFELLRVGKELQIVSGPAQGVAGAPFPQPFEVQVIDNGTKALVSGEPIRFRLLDGAGAPVQAVDATTLGDGKASANLAPPTPGNYSIEAVCAGCPASSQELGQGSKVVFPVSVILGRNRIALRKLDCDGASPIGFPRLEGLRVQAVDLVAGRPSAGKGVIFTPLQTPGGGGFSLVPQNPEGTITDAQGVARANATLSNVPGDYRVLATCQHCDTSPEVECAFSGIAPPQLTAPLSSVALLGSSGWPVGVTVSPADVVPAGTPGNTIATARFSGPPNETFRVSVGPVTFTGGHQHDNPGRPTGLVRPAAGFFGPDGTAAVTYEAGETGGMEIIEVSVAGEMVGRGAVTVSVVPALERLTPSIEYISQTGDGTHPAHLYGGPELQEAIRKIARAYLLERSALVSLNDMSLINGGLFDVRGTWNDPHVSHRRGTSVDLNRWELRILPGLTYELKRVPGIAEIIERLLAANGIACRRFPEGSLAHFECPP
jgi:hypothetical protein